MDANGIPKTMTCTRVEPFTNLKGETPEERGATRYLGTYLSFLGWAEQERVTIRSLRKLSREIMKIPYESEVSKLPKPCSRVGAVHF